MQRHAQNRAHRTHTVSTNNWHQSVPRFTLFAMSEYPTRRIVFRVLGVDPAAAGPTGYGIVESDGRNCRLLHYGALKVAEKLRKESAGAALEAVHTLI